MTTKIAFIGTHGAGKTTLAHETVSKLKKKDIDAEFLGEIVRDCPLPINENTTKKAQIWLILNQITRELEKEDKTEMLVCDRSVLDHYCYYINMFGKSKILEPLVREHLKTYKLLIKVPIRQGFLKDDKFRSTSEIFQKRIENIMNELLKIFKIRHISLKEFELNKKDILNLIK